MADDIGVACTSRVEPRVLMSPAFPHMFSPQDISDGTGWFINEYLGYFS